MGRPLHVPPSAGPRGKFIFSNVTNLTFGLDPVGHNGDNPDQDSVWAGEPGDRKPGIIRFMNATVVLIYHTKKIFNVLKKGR